MALSASDKLVSLWVNIEPKISDCEMKNITHTLKCEEITTKRNYVLNWYTITVPVGICLALTRAFLNFYFCTKAGRRLHKSLTYSIMNSYMTFFDTHFIGNILNRFSKDFHAIDELIPYAVYENFRAHITITGIIILIASVNLTFLVPAGFLFIKLYLIRRYYIPTGRSLRRLEAACRSPVIGYLNATLEGLTTIRAYKQQTILAHEFDRHQDLFTSAVYMNQYTSRAFGFSLDITCSIFIAAIVLKFIIFSEGVQAGDVGLALSQAMMLTGMLQYAIRQITEIENSMTSVERVAEYTDIQTEDTTSGQVKQNWPSQGKIRYENVRLTYKSTGENVLKNVNFLIEGRQKIGIVGRTGAGKSSIISTLFRLYDMNGTILIDNEDIKTLCLQFLRSNMAIIPQDPVLFSGTIRNNIDPLEKYDDNTIWNAIGKVNMKHLIPSLDTNITEKGLNYSAGQRQLLCLARALISENKIIILDEATASMDPETDVTLQNIIKEKFSNCTVLTIAHRLQSIMNCDKVLVVDSGRIVEYDAPNVLLSNKQGIFNKMIQNSSVL